jgi:L-lactate dehydrogenase complex protein LldE
MRIQLFGTCLVDSLFPDIGEAMLKIFRAFGVEATFTQGQTCCGQPAFNAGYHQEAKKAAQHFLQVFSGSDIIVTPSGSCAAMVKQHYPDLFRNDAELFKKAEDVAARVYELTQFLVHELHLPEKGLRGQGKVTYHSSCHLTRMLNVTREPILLLESMQGLEFVPLPDATRCCGFGGVFMAKLPEISMALAEEKADDILATGADTVTGCDAGCLMNIADGLKRRGSTIKVKHIAELIAEGL